MCTTGTGDPACGAVVPPTTTSTSTSSTTSTTFVSGCYIDDVDNRYTWGQCTLNTGVFCQPNPAAAATCAAQTGGAVGCQECGMGEGTCNVDPFPLGAITTIWDWVNHVNAAAKNYWSASSSGALPSFARDVDFGTGDVFLDHKHNSRPVRAVRPGS